MATDFLLAAGTGGFIATPFDLLSSELNGLTNGAAATSSVGGSSGVFTQSNTASAPQGGIAFKSGGSVTPGAGGYLAGWFLISPDGTNYESLVATPSTTVPALPRAPDFIIPLDNAALASGNWKTCSGRFAWLPWESFKVVVQNMSGATLPATGNLVTLGPTALQAQ